LNLNQYRPSHLNRSRSLRQPSLVGSLVVSVSGSVSGRASGPGSSGTWTSGTIGAIGTADALARAMRCAGVVVAGNVATISEGLAAGSRSGRGAGGSVMAGSLS